MTFEEVESKIDFKSNQLTDLLNFFGYSFTSEKIKSMPVEQLFQVIMIDWIKFEIKSKQKEN